MRDDYSIFLSLFSRSESAEMKVAVQQGAKVIVIEGEIVPDDYTRFLSIVKWANGEIGGIILFSPGGDFNEAMRIGHAVRKLELSSTVPNMSSDGLPICGIPQSSPPELVTTSAWPPLSPSSSENCTCASACFLIHIGSVHRSGSYLAVHRPYPFGEEFGRLLAPNAEAKFDALQDEAKIYMTRMGVPTHIQDWVLSVPSNDVEVLDSDTLRRHFSGFLPYRYEWIRNTCSLLDEDMLSLYSEYKDRVERGGELAPYQKNLFDSFSLNLQREKTCPSIVSEKSRLTAYHTFFNNESWNSLRTDPI